MRRNLTQRGALEARSDFVAWGYKEVMFPKWASERRGGCGFKGMALNALHIWPRKDHFLMALANPDGYFWPEGKAVLQVRSVRIELDRSMWQRCKVEQTSTRP